MEINISKKGASESFNKWCDVSGNPSKLAAHFGVSAQAVSQWRKLVPAERLLAVARFTGISGREMRPDLYPIDEEAVA